MQTTKVENYFIKQILLFFIQLLVVVLIVDPSDKLFQLKIPCFLLIFIIWIFKKVYSKAKSFKINDDIYLVVIILLGIPVYGIISGSIQASIEDWSFAFGFLKSIGILLLVLILIDEGVPAFTYLIRYSILIPLILFPVYILFFLNPDLIPNIVAFLVVDKEEAIFGPRNYYGFELLMLFYKTSPLLVFPLAFYLNEYFKKHNFVNLTLAIIFLLTLILSGTRMDILIAFFISVYFLLSFFVKNGKRFSLLSCIFLLVVSLTIFASTLSFDGAEESQDIKSGHFSSYITDFKENPLILIYGQGLGSKFFSTGVNSKIIVSELTYIELIRVFGIPIFVLFLFIILYPILNIKANPLLINKDVLIISYLSYLIIAGTNPLLISSTGIFVICILYSYCNSKNRKVIEKAFE